MISIREQFGLPFVTVKLHHQGDILELNNIVLDTGAAITVFRTDDLEKIGVVVHNDDIPQARRGIGGIEYALEKSVDKIELGGFVISNFVFDMSAVEYGEGIDGLLGFDFLQQVGAVIDLKKGVLYAEA